MLDQLWETNGNYLVVGALALILLVALFALLKRSRTRSPFARGTRENLPRLQVLDAATVDERRRLVLVRRDNVEHLILIGGMTDIVIESGINTPSSQALQRPNTAFESQKPAPAALENAVSAPRKEPAPATPAPEQSSPPFIRPATTDKNVVSAVAPSVLTPPERLSPPPSAMMNSAHADLTAEKRDTNTATRRVEPQMPDFPAPQPVGSSLATTKPSEASTPDDTNAKEERIFPATAPRNVPLSQGHLVPSRVAQPAPAEENEALQSEFARFFDEIHVKRDE